MILTGPCQVGKTYMGRQLMSQFKTPLYLNWDIPEDRVRLQTQSRYDQNDLVIMEKIHKMTNWKQWLKGITDAKSPGTALLVTGSARMDTFRQAGESLAGRYYSYRMHPISVKELSIDTQIKPREALDHLLERGGFPEPFLADQLELVLRWRTDYAKDILREDILEFSRLQELNTMKIFIEILGERVGSLLSLASIARDIGCSPITLSRYLDILQALFVVFTIHPMHDNIARSLLKTPKVYFYDQGLVRGNEGAKLENAVACMLLNLAQEGERYDLVKVLKGYGGAGVLEVIADNFGDTYRAVYTVKFSEAIFVLHCFQKKSKQGIATPKEDLNIILSRLKIARLKAKELSDEKK